MLVTVVADVFGEANNGTTIAAIHLIDALKKAGHDVRVVCPDNDKKGKDNFYIVGTYWVGPFQSIVDKNGVSLAKPNRKTLDEALLGSDEVHIMMPFAVGRKALKIAKEKGIPVSAGFHVQAENVTAHFFNLMNSHLANKLVYRNFWKNFYKGVDAIHYPTEFIRDVFEKAIQHTTPGYVISNGVSKEFHHIDVERDPELKGKFVILMSGRYSKEKKQTLLIKAVARSKHKKDIQIIFAGSGPREKEMRKCAEKYGVSPIYRFFKREELIQYLNMSDLYVHTSEIEIEAISCLEAISCGLVPLINNSPRSATKSFALSKNCLFKLNDVNDLSHKIDYWFEHPEEKEELAKKYQSYCKQFDFDTCMQKMVELVEETAKKKKI